MVELMDEDVVQELDERWRQRFETYKRAFNRLTEATEIVRNEPDHFLLRAGLIQTFEYTFELSWKVLQDLLRYKGYEFVQGPNGTLQKALEDGLITDHDGWRRMAKARITTSHTYNEGDAIAIVQQIYEEYSGLLKQLDIRLNEEKIRSEMNTLF